MYNIDVNKFKMTFSKCKNSDALCNLFDNILNEAGINTKERVNAFLAQCGHESGGFTITSENMNYSAKGLRGVFPKYFPTDDLASQYERKPEKIGNRVYANRMGNGDEASGEGYKFHGRGFIQLTGKDNYKAFGDAFGVDVLSNPDLVSTDLSLAIKSAVWFWNKNNLNKYADSGDFVGLTKRINGGTIGLEERQSNYNKLMS